MIRRIAFWIGFAVVLGAALALRAPRLGDPPTAEPPTADQTMYRPMHGDEAVHAEKFRALWYTGRYRYDPNEYHGPTLYYATFPSIWLSGARTFAETNAADYRITTVIFGVLLVASVLLFRDGLGRGATLIAALILALSPTLAFYSRYYIQEILLGCFGLSLLGCGWRYACSRKPGWIVGAGAAAGLMVATKETAVLMFVAAAIAGCPFVLTALRRSSDATIWPARHLGAAILAGYAVVFVLLSSFFTNLHGPFDLVAAYSGWIGRAGGTDMHNHPWRYYLDILLYTHRAAGPIWTEGILPIGSLAGIVAAFRRPAAGAEPEHALMRFLAVYTVTLIAIYSTIRYKTPWCLVGPVSTMALLAGYGIRRCLGTIRSLPARAVAAAACAAAIAHLGLVAYRTCFEFPTDGRNPYAYAQPVPDVVDLGERVKAIASASPMGLDMEVHVVATDAYYWPLPWYLRGLTNVGYWTAIPPNVAAPVVLASPEYDEEVTRRLGSDFLMTGYFGVRPAVTFEVFVRMGVWKAYLARRPKPRD